MNKLMIVFFALFFISCGNDDVEPETGSGSSVIGRWRIIDIDRPYNFGIEILDFFTNDSIDIFLDNDADLDIDIVREWAYEIKPFLGRDAIWLDISSISNNRYQWAYPSISNDTLALDMIRVDTPRIAHYIKIEE